MKKSYTSLSSKEVGKINKRLQTQQFFENSINVNRFVQARVKDIKFLESNVIGDQREKRGLRVFQRLPKHKRRRAMSHNVHLLPKYLRKYGIQEQKNLPALVSRRKKKGKKKRFLKKVSFLEGLEFESPNEEFGLKEGKKEGSKKAKRLYTHLFHAKRNFMRDIWNWNLPYRSHQKIFRTAYKFGRQHCLAYDSSYLICIQLEVKTSDNEMNDEVDTKNNAANTIINVLNDFKISNALYSQEFIDGKMEIDGLMFDNTEGNSNSLLSTVKLNFSQNTETTKCWIWVHPSSLPETYDKLKSKCTGTQIKISYRNDLSRFEIRGAHATTTLKRKSVMEIATQESSKKAQKVWNNIQFAGNCPGQMIVSLEITHPLKPFKPDFGTMNKKLNEIIEDKKVDDDEIMEETLDQLLLDFPEGIAESKDLWNSEKKEKDIFALIEDNEEEEENQSPEEKEKEELNKSHSLMLIQQCGNSGNEFGYGWDIICKRKVSVHLWSKIAKSKQVLQIPLIDRNRLRTEQGLLNFPMDYPDSVGFNNQINVLQDVYKFRKKKKTLKVNWNEVVGNNCFFYRGNFTICKNMENIHYVKIDVFCTWGGTPIPGGELFLPYDDDEFARIEQNKNKIEVKQEKRYKIGFLTSAIHSIRHGKGYAIGYARRDIIKRIPKKKFLVVLLKNRKNEKFLLPVQLKP